jgi:hypothetical protein
MPLSKPLAISARFLSLFPFSLASSQRAVRPQSVGEPDRYLRQGRCVYGGPTHSKTRSRSSATTFPQEGTPRSATPRWKWRPPHTDCSSFSRSHRCYPATGPSSRRSRTLVAAGLYACSIACSSVLICKSHFNICQTPRCVTRASMPRRTAGPLSRTFQKAL